MGTKNSNTFFQSWWRKIGVIAISIAALMAIISGPTRVLHDTVVHVVRMSGGELPENVTFSTPAFVCLLYWMIWFAALFTAVYMAILDFRFIRLNYAVERQVLFRQSLGDDFAESLLRKDKRS